MSERDVTDERHTHARYHWIPCSGDLEMFTGRFVRHVFAPHARESWTILVVERGAINVQIDGDASRLDAAGVLVLPPGTAQRAAAASGDGWEHTAIYPTDAQLAARLGTVTPPRIRGIVQQPLLAAATAQRMRMLLAQDSPANCIRILGEMLRAIWQTPGAPIAPYVQEDGGGIDRALAFIAANPGRKVSLATMARSADMSPYHFVRRFQARLRMTPYAYSLQLRVQMAKSLIDAGADLPTVAERTGFVDLSHLNRRFKRVMGLTAGAYFHAREIHRRHASDAGVGSLK